MKYLSSWVIEDNEELLRFASWKKFSFGGKYVGSRHCPSPSEDAI